MDSIGGQQKTVDNQRILMYHKRLLNGQEMY